MTPLGTTICERNAHNGAISHQTRLAQPQKPAGPWPEAVCEAGNSGTWEQVAVLGFWLCCYPLVPLDLLSHLFTPPFPHP